MYVYLIQAGEKKTSPVKVGFSKDPEGRLKTLQTGNHEQLRLIMKIKCIDDSHARRLERSLHEMLGTQNVHLEWFKLKKSHIMGMLTAFANNEDFDQVEHIKKLQHYSPAFSEISYKKKYKNLKKHTREMEAALERKKEGYKSKLKFMYGYIYDELGVSTKDIKQLMVDKIKE